MCTNSKKKHLQSAVQNFWNCLCLGTTRVTILLLISICIHTCFLEQILYHLSSLFLEVIDAWPWIKNYLSLPVVFTYSSCFCIISKLRCFCLLSILKITLFLRQYYCELLHLTQYYSLRRMRGTSNYQNPVG